MTRPVLAVLVLTGVALAGCASENAPAPTQQGDPTLPANNWMRGPNTTMVPMRGLISYTDHRGLEPTIGVDPDGRIFMTALDGSGSPVVVMSEDSRNWSNIGPDLAPLAPDQARHPITTDPYIHVDPVTGRVWTADLVHNCNVMSWTDDQGATWLTNPNACGPPGILDHQTYVSAEARVLVPTAYPRLLYVCANEIAYLDCAVSLDGGLTFGPQKVVDETLTHGTLCSALTGHLAAGPEGRVYLPTTECPTAPSPPVLYRTEDDSLTWTAHAVSELPSIDHDVTVAVDAAGGVHVAWEGVEGRTWLASSFDHAETFGPPVDVTPPDVNATAYRQITAGSEGRVAVVYIGSDTPGGYANIDGESLWYPYFAVVLDAIADEPTVRGVRLTDEPVAQGPCGRLRCGDFVDFIGMEVAPDGRPWASMIDRCRDGCGNGDHGAAVTLADGPSLHGGMLAPLA